MKRTLIILIGCCLTLTAAAQHTADSVQRHLNLNEVVVTGLTGTTRLRQSPAPVTVVSSAQLQQNASTNIIDALAHQPGISQVTTGSGISKPVIRGLGFNRVVVVDDGIRQEGQQWGDEHGIEIDAQRIHSVEILKGPASLMYGSDAMAGVLIMHDAPSPLDGILRADIGAEYQTNNGLIGYTVHLGANHGGLVWDARWSQKTTHAYTNKRDGYVYGSQFRERAASGMLGLTRRWGHSHLKLSFYQQTPGIVEGERDEETGAFVKPIIINGEPDEAIATNRDFHSSGHPLPYQQIRHYKAVSDNAVRIGDGMLKAIVGVQQNRRQEYEAEGLELDFRLTTLNYNVHYIMPGGHHWKYATGLSGMVQHSENLGDEFLIPAYRLADIGFFASATHSDGPLTLSGGARIDYRRLHSDGNEQREDERAAAVFTRHFTGLTFSAGAIYNVCRHLNIRLNLSRGFRAPNISELGSDGIHEGTFHYERGNARLRPEFSWQADAGIDYSSEHFSAQLALFCNHIENYVFLIGTGNVIASQPGEAATAEYRYTQGTARLWGGELMLDLHPVEALHFENTFAMVNAVQLHQPRETRYLPMTPAPRWTSSLRHTLIGHTRHLQHAYVSAGIECYLRQNHYYAADGSETATPSYTLVNAAAGTDIVHRGRRLLTVTLAVNNLTNRAYQSHLSRLKYAPVHPLTGYRGVCNIGRNVSIKLAIPLEVEM